MFMVQKCEIPGNVFSVIASFSITPFTKVPFLDILTAMLDPSLPLTAQEYEEWGDPR